MDLTKLTKKQLQDEINEYENLQCFGVNDMRYLDTLYREAHRRGYEITHTKQVVLQ